tara:strand:+ start:1259 stop:1555 length:297 start_codon:yes stop_codon:yes gene_type:complete
MTTKFKQNIGKKEIIENVKVSIGLSSKIIQEIIYDLIDVTIETLVKQQKINIKNFGSFHINHKKQREGRNPKTKQVFGISSRNVIKFKASDALKQKIN